jgi:hypothetical protein
MRAVLDKEPEERGDPVEIATPEVQPERKGIDHAVEVLTVLSTDYRFGSGKFPISVRLGAWGSRMQFPGYRDLTT